MITENDLTPFQRWERAEDGYGVALNTLYSEMNDASVPNPESPYIVTLLLAYISNALTTEFGSARMYVPEDCRVVILDAIEDGRLERVRHLGRGEVFEIGPFAFDRNGAFVGWTSKRLEALHLEVALKATALDERKAEYEKANQEEG